MTPNLIEQFRVLPENLANHLQLTVLALAIGLAISFPLAIFVVKHERLRYPTMTAVSIIQTIPSLALLALMVPVFLAIGTLTAWLFGLEISALGFYPALVGLTLYSLLPMVRNIVTGILGVDPSMTEAARGVGMTPRQVLWRVELPLAAPVIIAGIRTATVWVVGIATLATPVGQRCLGNYIFRGLQTYNWTAVLFGCIAAALLAVLLDLLIGGLEKSARERRRRLAATSAGMLILLFTAGLAAPGAVAWWRDAPLDRERAAIGDRMIHDGPDRNVVRLGSKNFSEQFILTALMADLLREAGFRVEEREGLGSIVVFQALANNEIDAYVEYTGTVWANSMRREDTPPAWRVMDEMNGWLAGVHGIRNFGPLGFENAYGLAMRREDAERLNITSIADLAEHAADLKIGGDVEYFGRPEWYALRDTYGLSFEEMVSYQSTFMYPAVASGDVDVISAFTSDGRIDAFDLVLLDDPHEAILPYDAVILLSPEASQWSRLHEALEPLRRAIPIEAMRQANQMVDRDEDRRTVEEAARWLRDELDL